MPGEQNCMKKSSGGSGKGHGSKGKKERKKEKETANAKKFIVWGAQVQFVLHVRSSLILL